jgi:hypothetical protein
MKIRVCMRVCMHACIITAPSLPAGRIRKSKTQSDACITNLPTLKHLDTQTLKHKILTCFRYARHSHSHTALIIPEKRNKITCILCTNLQTLEHSNAQTQDSHMLPLRKAYPDRHSSKSSSRVNSKNISPLCLNALHPFLLMDLVFLPTHVCMHVCMHACMYLCEKFEKYQTIVFVYVCMYACMDLCEKFEKYQTIVFECSTPPPSC